jgi:hypothetical protein
MKPGRSRPTGCAGVVPGSLQQVALRRPGCCPRAPRAPGPVDRYDEPAAQVPDGPRGGDPVARAGHAGHFHVMPLAPSTTSPRLCATSLGRTACDVNSLNLAETGVSIIDSHH